MVCRLTVTNSRREAVTTATVSTTRAGRTPQVGTCSVSVLLYCNVKKVQTRRSLMLVSFNHVKKGEAGDERRPHRPHGGKETR